MDAKKRFYLNKEKEKINEIILYVENNVIKKNTQEYDNFVRLLKELFSLEASIYGMKYALGDEEDNIIFNVVDLKSDGTSGCCVNNVFFDEMGRCICGKVEIIVNSNTYYFEELALDKEHRVNASKKIIKTIFHEFVHFHQLRSFKTHLSSEKALKHAKEFVFIEGYENTSKVYQENHNAFAIENDADVQAYSKFMYLVDDTYDKEKKNVKLSNYFSSSLFITDRSGRRRVVSREEHINKFIDYLIINKKYNALLNKYPILKKEYTFECKRRNIVELANKMKSEIDNIIKDINIVEEKKDNLISNTKEMYFSIFNRILSISSEEDKEEFYSILGIDMINEIINYNNKTARDEENILYSLYLNKNKNSSKFNYLKRNLKNYFISYEGDNCYVVSFEEFKNTIDFNSYSEEKRRIIEEYFISHIPECGFILMKDNTLINPFDFFYNYFLVHIDSIKDINDYFDFLEQYTESENKLLYIVGKKRIYNSRNKKNECLYEIINTYGKEMKR